MKKRFALFIGLFCLSLGILIAVPVLLRQKADQIEIVQRTIQGDLKEAEGLDVVFRTSLYNRMFWETRYPAQDAGSAETELSVFQQEKYRWERTESLQLELENFNFGMSTSHQDGLRLEELGKSARMAELVEDVAKDVAPGTKGSKRVQLSDWFEYWPFNIDSNYMYTGESAPEPLQEYFKIPMPEDVYATYTVEKNQEGKVYDLNVESELYGFLESSSVKSERGWYLVLDSRCYPVGQEEVDLSQIEGGYGVYFLPVDSEGELDVNGVDTVYKVREEEYTVSIQMDERGNLLLYTVSKEGMWYLTVLREETMQEVQRLELGQLGVDNSLETAVCEDGFFVQPMGNQKLLLLSQKEEGYQLESVLSLPEAVYIIDMSSIAFAWDGERLGMVCPSDHRLNHYIAVWRDDTLSYLGAYTYVGSGEEEVYLNTGAYVELDQWKKAFELEWSTL